MKHWPVPDSYSKNITLKNSHGSFWENKKDRYHCEIDIYANVGSIVESIEDGQVIKTGLFTSPKKNFIMECHILCFNKK